MRIVSGHYKGRRIQAPRNLPVRPTTDFSKTALFNILANYFDFTAIKMLDLFTGTGSISYEFASRGCPDITAVDIHPGCVEFVRKTATTLRMPIRVHHADVFQFIHFCKEQYHIIFAGPPYMLKAIETLPDKILKNNLLKENGWFILEHSPALSFEEHPDLLQVRHYGNTQFSIFTRL